MSKQVTVTANPESGKVFTPNAEVSAKDGKQYGYIRLESNEWDFNGGVARLAKRSALKSMLASDFAASPIPAGTKMEGQIIRKDTLEAVYEGHKAMRVPAKNAAGELVEDQFSAVTCKGAPVYRQDIFTQDLSLTDDKLEYDEIKAFVKTGKNTVLSGSKK